VPYDRPIKASQTERTAKKGLAAVGLGRGILLKTGSLEEQTRYDEEEDVDGNRRSGLNDCEFDVRKAQLVPPITEPDGKNHDSELGKKRKVEPTLNLGRVCDEES
jgi:hypothetical protein